MMKTLIVALMTSSVAFGTLAGAAISTKPAMMGTTSMGKAWVDAKGMALYTFDKDKGGKSMCNDKCATEWPPLAVAKDGKAAGHWTIVIRDDKSQMWAYKGHPLYTFIDDKKPGAVTGDNKDGFHLAK